MKYARKCLLMVVATAALLPIAAGADGIIIPFPYPYPYPMPPWPEPRPVERIYSLDIKYHRVETVIDGQLGTTHVDEVFKNPYHFDVEGTYIFPLPKGAAIDRFALKVDGEPVEGAMLDADEAAAEYRKLVNQNKDPALLEYIGRGAVRARIYPIPADGEKRVEITYSELLPYDGGLIKFVYPLDTERFSRQPIEDVDLNIKIKNAAPIETVFSPSHKVQLEKTAPNEAEVKYHAAKVKPAADFVLYYGAGTAEIGARLLAHKDPGEDGYFVFVVTPPAAPHETSTPKEVVFVIDTSGSMAGEKLDQVKAALSYCLKRLDPGDRFNVVAFNEVVTLFSDRALPASPGTVGDAEGFVSKLTPGGGTNIDAALGQALASASPEPVGPVMVVFLTDGKPTVGERNAADIVANAFQANTAHARIFAFGVGYNVKTELLDDLARKNGGAAQYVEPGEDIDVAVTTFYNKVSQPVLTDVALTWDGVEVYDLYPPALGDLFAGAQLTLMARYRGELPDGGVTLTGSRGGAAASFRYGLAEIATASRDNKFIPRLWATRKIGFLLEQIKVEGEDKELIDAVVVLSKRYGVPTPYTSYLVTDVAAEAAVPAPTIWRSPGGELDAATLGAAGGWLRESSAAETPAAAFRSPASADELAVRESKAIGRMKGADVAAPPYSGEAVRYVEDKSFRRGGAAGAAGVWRDLVLDEVFDGPTVEVVFGTDEYFDLLTEKPALAAYFALGGRIEVVFDGVFYRVTTE